MPTGAATVRPVAVARPRPATGRVIVLNGAPRSGKSSIVEALLRTADRPTMNLGVDLAIAATAPSLRPGIGLRPGGEHPELEGHVQVGYRALFDSIASHARHGIDVVADLGIHDDHARPLGIWTDAARRLWGVPTHVVGVRCSLDVVIERRARHPERYERGTAAAMRWERAVHDPGWYDAEVDTSARDPETCAAAVRATLAQTEPKALLRHR